MHCHVWIFISSCSGFQFGAWENKFCNTKAKWKQKKILIFNGSSIVIIWNVSHINLQSWLILWLKFWKLFKNTLGNNAQMPILAQPASDLLFRLTLHILSRLNSGNLASCLQSVICLLHSCLHFITQIFLAINPNFTLFYFTLLLLIPMNTHKNTVHRKSACLEVL